jgi:hypothetical protein
MKLGFTEPFKIPEPFRAWCHYCNRGFLTQEELDKHNADNLNNHRRINGAVS